MITLPTAAEEILRTLNQNGFEAYVVGGCVRDSMLGKQPNDWDITTNALPEQTKRCFFDDRVLETGLRHGTLTILRDGQAFEVTTYRVDGAYENHRRPEQVNFTASLREDLARRDFTVNAMAYHPQRGIQDFFGGQEDLRKKLLCCVGKPTQRFEEDALRILRALRFASVLDFTIQPDTAAAMAEKKRLLHTLAAERVQAELTGLLCGQAAERVLLQYCEILPEILPEVRPLFDFDQRNPHHTLNLWEHTVRAVSLAEPIPALRLAMLFHDLGKPDCFTLDTAGIGHFYRHEALSAERVKLIFTRLRLDKNTAQTAAFLIEHHGVPITAEERAIKHLLNRFGEQRVKLLLAAKRADSGALAPSVAKQRLEELAQADRILQKILAENACFSLRDLAVHGKDLLALGLPPGRQIGEILKKLLECVIKGTLPNESSALLDCVQENWLSKEEKFD